MTGNMLSASEKLILLTGSSGYLGNHILAVFLAAGYKIRLAVRTTSSGERLLEIHSKHSHLLSYSIVPDITLPGAFDVAVRGVTGVVHTASPVIYNVEDNERDLLLPAIQGTKGLLEAVFKHAPECGRVVLTSSFAAIVDRTKGSRVGYVYTEEDWNPIGFEEAKADRSGRAYSGSKKLAEKAAWDFVAENPVQFTLTSLNPPMIYGPFYPGSSPGLTNLGLSPAQIYAMFNGSCSEVPETKVPAYVDVRDVALAHLKAFESEESGRFLVAKGKWDPREACMFLREKFPERRGLIPDPGVGEGEDTFGVDAGKSRRVLGMVYRGFEQTFGDMAEGFVELEKEEKEREVM